MCELAIDVIYVAFSHDSLLSVQSNGYDIRVREFSILLGNGHFSREKKKRKSEDGRWTPVQYVCWLTVDDAG